MDFGFNRIQDGKLLKAKVGNSGIPNLEMQKFKGNESEKLSHLFKKYYLDTVVYLKLIGILSKVFSFQMKMVPIQKNPLSRYYSYRYMLDNVILFHPMSELISMPRI